MYISELHTNACECVWICVCVCVCVCVCLSVYCELLLSLSYYHCFHTLSFIFGLWPKINFWTWTLFSQKKQDISCKNKFQCFCCCFSFCFFIMLLFFKCLFPLSVFVDFLLHLEYLLFWFSLFEPFCTHYYSRFCFSRGGIKKVLYVHSLVLRKTSLKIWPFWSSRK